MVVSTPDRKNSGAHADGRPLPAGLPVDQESVELNTNTPQKKPANKKSRSKKKNSNKTKADVQNDKLIKGSRGIDTLLRNAYHS